MRTKLICWSLLLGVACCLTPMGTTPVEGCGRRGGGCCIQYVYVYVGGGGGGGGGGGKAGKIHFFLVLDTSDPTAGLSIKDTERKLTALYNSIPEDHKGKLEEVPESQLTPGNVLDQLRAFRVAPDDTLMVFCNTHGEAAKSKEGNGKEGDKEETVSTTEQEQQPAPPSEPSLGDEKGDDRGGQAQNLILHGEGDAGKLKRDLLYAALNEKDCRLKLLITDACFVTPEEEELPDLKAAPGVLVAVVKPPKTTRIPRLQRNAYKDYVIEDLFLNHTGQLNMNSASRKEYAVFNVFVDSFTEMIDGNPSYNSALTWQQFVGDLQPRVVERFKNERVQPDNKATDKVLKANNQTSQTVAVFKDPASGKQYPTYSRFKAEEPKSTAAAAPGAAPMADAAEPDEKEESPPDETPPGEQARNQNPAPANIVVKVPDQTQLFVNDQPTNQTTSVRRFVTPTLTPGQTATYVFRAERTVDGKKVVDSKEVAVKAGGQVEVTFDSQPTGSSVAGR